MNVAIRKTSHGRTVEPRRTTPSRRSAEDLDRLPIAVFACEYDSRRREFRLKYHNRQLQDVLGVDTAALLLDANAFFHKVSRRDLARVRRSLRSASALGSERRAEMRIEDEGRTRWIEMRAVVHIDNGGRFVISGCCWDITALKESERDFQKFLLETGRLKVQTKQLPIGLVICESDSDAKITEWNTAAERIFGYSREEAIGRSALELIVHPQDRSQVREVVTSDLGQGNAGNGCNVRKDGSRIWCHWVNTPLFDSHGNVIACLSLVLDISEQLENERRMNLWASVIQQSREGIMICNAEQKIVLVNKAFEEITGYSQNDAVGQSPRILQSGRQDRSFYERMWASVAETGQWSGEIWNRRKSGELYVEWLSLTAVRDSRGFVDHFIGSFSDITVRKETEERVRRLAHFDALTGLPNRSLLMDRASQVIAACRKDGRKAAIFFIDLDRFKNINDSMGHEAGDELLKVVAERLSHLMRPTDTVARMGGDEFVICATHIDDVSSMVGLAERILATVNSTMSIGGQELSISGSVGICIYPDDANDVSGLIRNADAAMYGAKNSGRNAYQFYTPDMNARAMEILETESALRNALVRNEFVLHYQPQVNLTSGEVVGLEALIRWNRPGAGMVMPGQFIPIAEERGLIAAVGQWTLGEVARQAAEWDRAGLPKIPIALNLSASEFHQHGFVERVAQTIEMYGLDASRFELEITETAILRDTNATIDILNRLRNLGVKLSIDDFGTGYSSLNYLRRFPIHRIKIDRSFVKEMLEDEGAAGIVRGIIGLADSLKLEVIAEGVETVEQIQFLQGAGCEYAQGFAFSAGLAHDAIVRMLQDEHRTFPCFEAVRL